MARHHKSSFFSILQLKLNMLIVPIIFGTCCFITNTEICVLISQLMLVSIHGCTALVGGQNCDKIDRNFCYVCYIEPIFCQASLVTLKIIKQPSCNYFFCPLIPCLFGLAMFVACSYVFSWAALDGSLLSANNSRQDFVGSLSCC